MESLAAGCIKQQTSVADAILTCSTLQGVYANGFEVKRLYLLEGSGSARPRDDTGQGGSYTNTWVERQKDPRLGGKITQTRETNPRDAGRVLQQCQVLVLKQGQGESWPINVEGLMWRALSKQGERGKTNCKLKRINGSAGQINKLPYVTFIEQWLAMSRGDSDRQETVLTCTALEAGNAHGLE